MKRKFLAVAGIAGLLGAGTAVAAPAAWKVVAKGTGTGSYAIANVSASVDKPHALAVRSTSGTADVTWSFSCSGKTHALKGRLYALAAGNATDCTVSALGSGDGRVTVQILRR